MAELQLQLDTPVTDETGRTYVVRICGRPGEDGLWEGWIEFDPRDGAATLTTPRETKQPKRSDLEYWASGLTTSYLEGAMERARLLQTPELHPATLAARPTSDPPARPRAAVAASRGVARARAVLDPFEVYAQGEDVLRQELSALSEGHLRNIIRAYGLAEDEATDRSGTHRSALAERIMAAVQSRLG